MPNRTSFPPMLMLCLPIVYLLVEQLRYGMTTTSSRPKTKLRSMDDVAHIMIQAQTQERQKQQSPSQSEDSMLYYGLNVTEVCSHPPPPSSNKEEEEIPQVLLDKRYFLHMHIGKGGGGTVNLVMKDLWGYDRKQCADTGISCTRDYAGNFGELVVFMPIRDPIDRFMSAFYWRIMVTCNPHGETRNQTTDETGHSLAVKYPHQWCKARSATEQAKLDRYDSNPKLLVQQLCTQDSTTGTWHVDTNSRAYSQDMTIRHLHKAALVDWLGDSQDNQFYDWRRHVHQLYPVVLEPGFDLTYHIHQAIRRSYQEYPHAYHNEPRASFERRQYRAMCDATAAKEDRQAATQHTTSGGSPFFTKVKLNKAEEACLAAYYQNDYRLLAELKDKACKSQSCVDALTSLLERRADILQP